MTHRIAWMPGDGVGPELLEQARRVLDAVTAVEGFSVDLVDLPNSTAHYHRTGVLMDDEAYATLGSCAALMFGAAGDPSMAPGVIERALILDVATRLDLCVGLRPAYLYADRLTPLKDRGRGDVDVLIVRDTTEGEMQMPGGRLHAGTPHEVAATIMMHTRHGVERAVRLAFAEEGRRRGRVTLVGQSNVVVPHQLWEDVFHDVAAEHPDVAAEALYPDNFLLQIVTDPRPFDVIVTNLMLGGYLTDLVAGLVGGIGLVGSSRVNPVTGFGLFEPAHGSAPRHAGRDTVSPMATLLALAMLLDAIGEPAGAGRITAAVDQVMASGRVPSARTDSGVGTRAATDAVIEALGAGDRP